MNKAISILALCVLPTISYAHQSGSGDVDASGFADRHAPIGVMGDHRHDAGEWMVSYRYMDMEMYGHKQGDDSIGRQAVASLPGVRVVPREMRMEMHMFGLMYGVSDDFTAMASPIVAETCDDVVVMHGGTICETANVFDIFDRPNHRYTKSLLASIPRLDSQPKSILPVLTSITERRKESDANLESLNYRGNIRDSGAAEMTRTEPHNILKVDKLAMYFPIREGVLGRIKSYNRAVDEVSFSISKGQTLGLVGESGCGKSTIARCVLRLYSPTSGNIIFDGADISKLKANQLKLIRNDLQMIFQDPMDSLNPRHTASEIIGEPLLINNFSRIYREKRVLELLDIVGLPKESLKKYPFEFSGGQKQRIGIARALALRPRLVVCDEAVSALDVSTQAQVLNLLLDLIKKSFFLKALQFLASGQ